MMPEPKQFDAVPETDQVTSIDRDLSFYPSPVTEPEMLTKA